MLAACWARSRGIADIGPSYTPVIAASAAATAAAAAVVAAVGLQTEASVPGLRNIVAVVDVALSLTVTRCRST